VRATPGSDRSLTGVRRIAGRAVGCADRRVVLGRRRELILSKHVFVTYDVVFESGTDDDA